MGVAPMSSIFSVIWSIACPWVLGFATAVVVYGVLVALH